MTRTAIALAGLLAAGMPRTVLAQGDPGSAFSRCAVISAGTQRLACYDSAANRRPNKPASSSPIADVGKWRIDEKTNALDDSKTVVLSLTADEGRGTFGERVSLVVRCMSKEVQVYIDWGSYLGLKETTVTSRIGNASAVEKTWGISTDNKASFYPDDVLPFLKELMAADRFVARVTPYSESPVTAVFAVTGMWKALAPLRKSCAVPL